MYTLGPFRGYDPICMQDTTLTETSQYTLVQNEKLCQQGLSIISKPACAYNALMQSSYIG